MSGAGTPAPSRSSGRPSSRPVDVLAIGAHPDDVELGCGGTVASLVGQGRRLAILHLSCGEAGSRGTVAERRSEAEAAAEILGASELRILDCGDGALRTGLAEEEAVITVLRELRPALVLGPTPSDRHPDHGRAHRLVRDACFYAGLAARSGGDQPPHRPAAVFSYMQHDPFEPTFIVDVSETWELKSRALDAYVSQLYQGDRQPISDPDQSRESSPITKVSTPEFRSAIEGRARHYGNLIGARHGEPFWSRLPVAVRDPMSLLAGGVL